ncbi:hypothetical protein [Streptomyces gardneri]|uniref:hypothetical protein n=1 Tax=Streptomyces gardneri TaxID=66892 RepID=UPI00369EC3EF
MSLAVESGEGIEAGLAQGVDLGMRMARPGFRERDVTLAHDHDVAAVQGRPRNRLRHPRAVLDVDRVDAVAACGVHGECAQGGWCRC